MEYKTGKRELKNGNKDDMSRKIIKEAYKHRNDFN